MSDVTQILSQIESGDAIAAEQLLPLVYDELRKLAVAKLAHEKPGQTLQPTALVHEAYLRLVGPEDKSQESAVGEKSTPSHRTPDACLPTPAFHSRGHFFAAAAQAMRRILIDAARRKAREKHGGQWQRVELGDCPEALPDEQLLALDEALVRLAAEDDVAAQVVELHHFAGLSHEQVAATLGTSVYQARQKWTYARAWLADALANS